MATDQEPIIWTLGQSVGGAEVSVTVRMDPAVKRAIAGIPEAAWTTIEYTEAVFDETTNMWVSRAEVPETVFTAFSSRVGRLADVP